MTGNVQKLSKECNDTLGRKRFELACSVEFATDALNLQEDASDLSTKMIDALRDSFDGLLARFLGYRFICGTAIGLEVLVQGGDFGAAAWAGAVRVQPGRDAFVAEFMETGIHDAFANHGVEADAADLGAVV